MTKKIILDPNVGRPGDSVSVRGDVIEIDLDKIITGMAEPLEKATKDAVAHPFNDPQPSTVKRRGAGRMHSVTGALRSGIKAVVSGGRLDIVAPADHFKHWFPKARLFQTTALNRMAKAVREAAKKALPKAFKRRRKA